MTDACPCRKKLLAELEALEVPMHDGEEFDGLLISLCIEITGLRDKIILLNAHMRVLERKLETSV